MSPWAATDATAACLVQQVLLSGCFWGTIQCSTHSCLNVQCRSFLVTDPHSEGGHSGQKLYKRLCMCSMRWCTRWMPCKHA
jgi:hypothetical protein